MSMRSRRRRANVELLREARSIPFPDGSGTEDETDHTDAVRIEPTQTDHTDAVRAEPEHRQTDHTDAVRIEPTQTDQTDAVRAEPEQRRTAYTDNQMDQVEQQLARQPYALPTIAINPAIKDLFEFRFDDFSLQNYEHHPHIAAPVAV